MIVIPNDLYAIERMMEEGHWDRRTYTRLTRKKAWLLNKEFGKRTARQQCVGFRRGRLSNEDDKRVHMREAVNNLFDIVTSPRYNSNAGIV